MEKKIDQILSDVLTTVAEKRRDGIYPPGLEQELEYEFSHLLSQSVNNNDLDLSSLIHLITDRLAVVDHLSMMIIDLEQRIYKLENKDLLDDH
jgi:hypothetical protein